MEKSYMDNWPQGHRFGQELLMFGGGGSSGGGGTSSTTANMMPWKNYVPGETYRTYKEYLPKVAKGFDEGLTPQEKAQYKGDILSNTANQFSGAQKNLNENLARSGVKGGAAAESMSDLARGRAIASATGLSQLNTTDIQKKQQSRDELRRWVGLPSAPVQVGSTTTTSPSGGGGS